MVGPPDKEVKTWKIPSRLITSQSKFFAAALRGGFVEAGSKSVSLLEEHPRDFGYWVVWLYTGKLSWDYKFFGTRFQDARIGAWTLGDKLGCQAYQDTALLYFMRNMEFDYHLADYMVRQAYEGSAPGSKLRKFVVDEFRWEVHQEMIEIDSMKEITEAAADIPDFPLDYFRSCMEREAEDLITPHEQKEVYLFNPTLPLLEEHD